MEDRNYNTENQEQNRPAADPSAAGIYERRPTMYGGTGNPQQGYFQQNAAQQQPAQNPYPYQIPRATPPKETKHRRGLFFVIGLVSGILVMLLPVLLYASFNRYQRMTTQSDIVTPEVIGKINAIQEKVDENFLFDTDVDYESGILKGYLNSLNDIYTVYYTPEEYKELMESMSGSFSGIGVLVQLDEATGYVRVVKPYESSPAYAAGMRADDLITKVEGEEMSGLDLDVVVSKIRGEEGTTVNLTVYRASESKYLDLTITRARIEVETVSYEMLENDIGYISMDSFDEVTYTQYMKAFNDLKAQGMKGLIVDIRNNGGGYLDVVVDILDEMLPEGIITYTEDKNGKREEYRSDAASVLDVPMAVLVNGYSASASEIFTGALQDYKKATIVGSQTFGKGIVQSIIGLNDGSAFKMTTSRYFTPNGVCIHETGITPDVVVEWPEDAEGDPDLEAATELLLEQIQ